jgi:hypothetical protein
MAKETTATTLKDYVRANSYARVPDEERQEEGWSSYKKGYEMRIVVKSQAEVRNLKRLLSEEKIKPGKPYRKAQQWVLPVYGKEAVTHLVKLKPRTNRPAIK